MSTTGNHTYYISLRGAPPLPGEEQVHRTVAFDQFESRNQKGRYPPYCNPNGQPSTGLRPASGHPWILPRTNQVSTGHLVTPVCALVPSFRIHPHPLPIKKTPPIGWCLFYWQRMRDSNPRKRSQSPVCYRYTNPLCWIYYTQFLSKVKKRFRLFQSFSSQGKGLPARTSSFR